MMSGVEFAGMIHVREVMQSPFPSSAFRYQHCHQIESGRLRP